MENSELRKTAMQELIEIIEAMPAFKYEPVVIGIHEKATELLAKEKEQIMVKDSKIKELKLKVENLEVKLLYYEKVVSRR